MRSTFRAVLVAGLAALAPIAAPPSVAAQSMDGAGAVSTGLLLRRLDGVKRVLMIAAHPDDEDTALLTTLARGWGAETAYLSLTRGDGGQNLIGGELFEGLGVVRTGELLAARHIDGGQQFFSRAFDYGFSKTADEALSFWPEEDLLEDVVWVIRRFRPQVVVTVWTGTPRDGHGQHQAAGIVAREAVVAAGDPTRFPEQLREGVEAWAPAKLYQSSRGFGGRGGGPAPEALVVPTGNIDPLLGRSLYQLSMESRSQHRSQEMGAAQPMGPRRTGVILEQSHVEGPDDGIFAGIDTTLVGLTASLPQAVRGPTRGHLEAYRSAVLRARDDFGLNLVGVSDDLAEALRHLGMARDTAAGAADTELDLALGRKLELATRAYMAASGIVFDVRAEDDLIVPGQSVRVTAQLWNSSDVGLSAPRTALRGPRGWNVRQVSVDGLAPDGSVAPGSLATWRYDVELPDDADVSRLYYLREPRDGAMYQWPDEPDLWGLPADPVPVEGSASFAPAFAGGAVPRIETSKGWRYVGVDPAEGEFEKRVLVVPAVSVQVAPARLVWPQSRTEAGTVSVVVHSEADGGSRGTLSVGAPAGWSVTPASQPFDLQEAGADRTLTFEVRPARTAQPGEHVFGVTARTDDGRSFIEGYSLIDYEHIERAALFAPAEARVTVVPVAVASGLRVGYVMGSGDDGPDAIRQLGVDVELLDEDQVRNGAFDGLHTIVLGVRAYETRPDVRAASEQLLDFARGGGVIIAQYARAPLGGLAPYPLDVNRSSPRVADELAPVRILDPQAPVFTSPNRIGASDFEGWVQERGLYFGSEWDDHYVPLLEMNDPGEPPRHGALLVTSVGDGAFAYAALSFFRQWSFGVPGAYRLFANLISLDPAAWRTYEAGR